MPLMAVIFLCGIIMVKGLKLEEALGVEAADTEEGLGGFDCHEKWEICGNKKCRLDCINKLGDINK